jgi:hypothetical protein
MRGPERHPSILLQLLGARCPFDWSTMQESEPPPDQQRLIFSNMVAAFSIGKYICLYIDYHARS